jgi:hypothetical protein
LLLLLRLPALIWRFLVQRALPAAFWLASFLRNPRQALMVWPAAFALGPRVALFIHFDSAGAVRPHVLHYLRALREAGLSVVFVTNSGRLRPEALAKLQEICAGIVVRRNVGYDFAAMREGLACAGLPRADTEMLLLVNDSVYGPLEPLAPVLERLDFAAADLWGLTESWQTRYHLQSYFIAFGRAALTSPAWEAFWRQVRPVSSKWWVILHYEIGLTQHFLRAGLRARAVWNYQDLLRRVPPPSLPPDGSSTDHDGYPSLLDPVLKGRYAQSRHIRTAASIAVPLNPTSDLWRALLADGFPFLKRELLRRNPTSVGDLYGWRALTTDGDPALLAAIEHDLQQSLRNRAI